MPSLEPDTARESPAPAVKLALWLVAGLAVANYAPSFVRAFVPPVGGYPDFAQEWLSTRNYFVGDPVYLPQREALRRHTGQDMPEFEGYIPRNAHPPVSLLVALPFGLIPDYRTAHLAWNLITFSLALLALAMTIRELPGGWPRWAVVPAVALFLTSSPVRSQLFQGQFNGLLLFLFTAAWLADRRGRPIASGIAVGVATALKLFPGLLLVYFVATRQWRAAVAAIATGLVLALGTLLTFGPEAFVTYVREVLPSLDVYRTWRANISATGYCSRLAALVGEPQLAHLALACQVLVVGAVAWAGWKSRASGDRDRAFCLAVVAMPFASPVAWWHYFVFVALPALVLWHRLGSGVARIVLLAAIALVWPPEYVLAKWVIGHEAAAAMPHVVPPPRDYALCLLSLGANTYALITLFLLAAFGRFAPRSDDPTSAPRTDRDDTAS